MVMDEDDPWDVRGRDPCWNPLRWIPIFLVFYPFCPQKF